MKTLMAAILLLAVQSFDSHPAGAVLAQDGDPPADPLKVFREEFVEIPAGSFTMGSALEKPAHKVTIARPFLIAKYEVPQNLWVDVMGGNPSKWKGRRNSVEMLSWHDAVAFCAKATAMMRRAKLIGETQEIRLPTEAEWEYCARA